MKSFSAFVKRITFNVHRMNKANPINAKSMNPLVVELKRNANSNELARRKKVASEAIEIILPFNMRLL